MARPPKNKDNVENSVTEDFANELIKEINKTHNEKIAFNLGNDEAPTHVHRWISTGSRQLDYIIANRRDGGMPEGRIVEIQGPPGIGKSTLMAQIARSTQRMDGIVVFIDTENATNPETLANMGVDVAKRFVFVQSPCTEEILSIIESTILKARTMTKDVPVTVIWDSVSQSSPKAELEGDYDQNTIGLQARVLSKGMRKIANVIGGQKVLLVLVSQQRMKIGCVGPDTVIQYRQHMETQIKTETIKHMFSDIGHKFEIMSINKPVPITGWEIKSLDNNGNVIWKDIKNIIRKQNAIHMKVTTSLSHTLSCSPEHKIYVKNLNSDIPFYEEVGAIYQNEKQYAVLTEQGWCSFKIEKIDEKLEIADLEVADSNSYLSNGILSHNTMFGDPTTTSGGMAIPYSSYVRVRLDGGSPIKDKDENIIGINVTAKTIKNKVAKPFRKVGFQIMFGKGIFENDETFDLLREYCKNSKSGVMVNNKSVMISGDAAWKTFTVVDIKTGEVETEVKFYKNEFTQKILNKPEYSDYINAMMDAALVISKDDATENHSTFERIAEGDVKTADELSA